MLPNLLDYLRHVVDKAGYLSVEVERLSREEFFLWMYSVDVLSVL